MEIPGGEGTQTPENEIIGSTEESQNNCETPQQTTGENLATLLGNKPKEETPVGPEIHTEIVCRWANYLLKGLAKEDKTSLIEKYPVPANCPALKAPVLNPEVEAILNPATLRQDSFLFNLQRQLAAGLSAISLPFNKLVSDPTEGNNQKELLLQLGDASKSIADSMHSLSLHRRYLIMPSLSMQCKKLVEGTGIADLLFDTNLQESLKAAQAMKRAGDEIRAPIPKKKTPTRFFSTPQPQPGTSKQYQALNYQRPASKSRYKQKTYLPRNDRKKREQLQTRRRQQHWK